VGGCWFWLAGLMPAPCHTDSLWLGVGTGIGLFSLEKDSLAGLRCKHWIAVGHLKWLWMEEVSVWLLHWRGTAWHGQLVAWSAMDSILAGALRINT